MKVRNTFIIFLVSGFWHGANWTFIVWGGLNALYFMPLLLANKNRNNLEIVAKGKLLPSIKEFLEIAVTFALTVFAWIFFRADTVTHALSYISGIFSRSLFSMPQIFPSKLLVIIVIFMLIEWLGREEEFALAIVKKINQPALRIGLYYGIIIGLVLFGKFNSNQFIYFQF